MIMRFEFPHRRERHGETWAWMSLEGLPSLGSDHEVASEPLIRSCALTEQVC